MSVQLRHKVATALALAAVGTATTGGLAHAATASASSERVRSVAATTHHQAGPAKARAAKAPAARVSSARLTARRPGWVNVATTTRSADAATYTTTAALRSQRRAVAASVRVRHVYAGRVLTSKTTRVTVSPRSWRTVRLTLVPAKHAGQIQVWVAAGVKKRTAVRVTHVRLVKNRIPAHAAAGSDTPTDSTPPVTVPPVTVPPVTVPPVDVPTQDPTPVPTPDPTPTPTPTPTPDPTPTPTPTPDPTPTPTPPVVTPTPPVDTPTPPVNTPNDVPTTAKLVFAHYFPPFPIHIDNVDPSKDYYARNYLQIHGEKDKYVKNGGFLRDRPVPTQPAARSDWQLEDLRTEVRQAKAAGINGFTLNVLTLSGQNWTASVNLMQAAKDVGGFTVVPNLDGTASASTWTPDYVADKLATLFAYSSAQKVAGEYLMSSFAPENRGSAFWDQVIQHLETDHHMPIKFIACFLAATDANMKAFAPFSYGFGNWGVRTVASVTKAPNFAAKAHALGKKWMGPISFQDARPNQNKYAEASNSETIRAMWGRAMSDPADYIQMVTWNDYSESTQFAPSMAHGSTLLDINRYWMDWWRSGKAGPITADHLYLTHRVMMSNAQVTSGIMNMAYTLGGMSTPPQDTVEALVFLVAPAQVSITTSAGTTNFNEPAGINAVTVPLKVGSISAKITRGPLVVKNVVSPYKVVPDPLVQDFQYWASGS